MSGWAGAEDGYRFCQVLPKMQFFQLLLSCRKSFTHNKGRGLHYARESAASIIGSILNHLIQRAQIGASMIFTAADFFRYKMQHLGQ